MKSALGWENNVDGVFTEPRCGESSTSQSTVNVLQLGRLVPRAYGLLRE